MAYTLAHLSDPHLAPLPAPHWSELLNKRVTGYLHWQRTRQFVHDPAVLAKIVADLKAHRPDHIAVTGDLANIALRQEFVRGREWLQALGSPQQVSFVPGNHDAYVRAGVGQAIRHWGDYMCGDQDAADFPYLRRRGPLALIGLSSAVPTAPFIAAGRLGPTQLARLSEMLDALKAERPFRVVLIHHPPVSQAKPHKRLRDAGALKRVLAEHGAELLLHGHDHVRMLNWLPGPDGTRVAAVGVPSASAAPGMSHDDAAYNLYTIDGMPGAWHCEMSSRGINGAGAIVEQQKLKLI
jgi:3',5'-cyclic AMP phosphodiesterase CpdA